MRHYGRDVDDVLGPFPPNTSIIISNFPKPEDESPDSLLDAVDVMINEGLALEEIDVKAVERTRPRSFSEAVRGEEGAAERPGVVKVRLGSVQQKVDCLRKKKDLNQKTAYKAVRIRGCEDHASRLNRLNMDTLLTHMGHRDEFMFTGSGRLVKKDSEDPNRRNTRSQTAGNHHSSGPPPRPPQPSRGGRGGQRGRGGRGGRDN